MLEGLKKLYSGDFNYMDTKILADDCRIVTLYKEGEDKSFKFKVRNLYGKDEEILEHEVIETPETPKHIKDRMEEAKKWKEEKDKEK